MIYNYNSIFITEQIVISRPAGFPQVCCKVKCANNRTSNNSNNSNPAFLTDWAVSPVTPVNHVTNA